MFALKSRNRIIPASAPGMTAADAADAEPEAFEEAVLFKGFDGVVGTGGCEPALGSEQG